MHNYEDNTSPFTAGGQIDTDEEALQCAKDIGKALQLEAMSTEAKVVYVVYWMLTTRTELTLESPYVVTKGFVKGLDELVEAGYLTKDMTGRGDTAKLTWRPTRKLIAQRSKL